MGLTPERMKYLAEAGRFLGDGALSRIEQLAERVVAPATQFEVVPEFESLRKKALQYTPAS